MSGGNNNPIRMGLEVPLSGRRRFMAGLGVLPLTAMAGTEWKRTTVPEGMVKGRGLLVSSTTVAGKKSLEHAEEALRVLFAGVERILLINFASLPPARERYWKRMRSDFKRIENRFEVETLHRANRAEAADLVKDAEAFFVSGGNTFLLLRELNDLGVLDLLRKRVSLGTPYAGSSAGSNLAGMVIGTTNDFPLVDIPSRQALGLLPGTYNPHHPDLADKGAFESRQWKLGQYAAYHPDSFIFGVNNAGMIAIDGDQLSLRGEGALAAVMLADQVEHVTTLNTGGISAAMERLRESVSGGKEVTGE